MISRYSIRRALAVKGKEEYPQITQITGQRLNKNLTRFELRSFKSISVRVSVADRLFVLATSA
jgi:hypothetical protein